MSPEPRLLRSLDRLHVSQLNGAKCWPSAVPMVENSGQERGLPEQLPKNSSHQMKAEAMPSVQSTPQVAAAGAPIFRLGLYFSHTCKHRATA